MALVLEGLLPVVMGDHSLEVVEVLLVPEEMYDR